RTTVCGNRCATERDKAVRREQKRVRRYRKRGATQYDNTITLESVVARYNNKCAICNEECNKEDYTTDGYGHFIAGNTYPSIDHIIPLSRKGTHTWSNVQLAHRLCNSIKNNEQNLTNKEIINKRDLLLN